MAYGFGSTLGTGTTDRIQTGVSVGWPTLATLLVAAYRNGAGGANVGTIMQHAGAVHYFRNNESLSAMQFNVVFTGGGQNNTWTFARPATGGWHRFAITYDANSVSNDPTAYLDGSSQTVTNIARASVNLNTTSGTLGLGNRASDNAVVWDGMVGPFALYNRILSAGELDAWADGASPEEFPRGLIVYQPLVRGVTSPIHAAATTNGTPVVQPHPRIVPLRTQRAVWALPIAPGSSSTLVTAGRPPWRGAWRGINRGLR